MTQCSNMSDYKNIDQAVKYLFKATKYCSLDEWFQEACCSLAEKVKAVWQSDVSTFACTTDERTVDRLTQTASSKCGLQVLSVCRYWYKIFALATWQYFSVHIYIDVHWKDFLKFLPVFCEAINFPKMQQNCLLFWSVVTKCRRHIMWMLPGACSLTQWHYTATLLWHQLFCRDRSHQIPPSPVSWHDWAVSSDSVCKFQSWFPHTKKSRVIRFWSDVLSSVRFSGNTNCYIGAWLKWNFGRLWLCQQISTPPTYASHILQRIVSFL